VVDDAARHVRDQIAEREVDVVGLPPIAGRTRSGRA
jgi:hypothetical protein